jgi:hypothetical protein
LEGRRHPTTDFRGSRSSFLRSRSLPIEKHRWCRPWTVAALSSYHHQADCLGQYQHLDTIDTS